MHFSCNIQIHIKKYGLLHKENEKKEFPSFLLAKSRLNNWLRHEISQIFKKQFQKIIIWGHYKNFKD